MIQNLASDAPRVARARLVTYILTHYMTWYVEPLRRYFFVYRLLLTLSLH